MNHNALRGLGFAVRAATHISKIWKSCPEGRGFGINSTLIKRVWHLSILILENALCNILEESCLVQSSTALEPQKY